MVKNECRVAACQGGCCLLSILVQEAVLKLLSVHYWALVFGALFVLVSVSGSIVCCFC